ncbi:MAG: hypothetical protein JXR77_01230 [Lentisphaeria bacterium]|nr:hypothetical protein [Lentisphaeria bacterium]
MSTLRTIVLVLGGLGVLKAVFILVWPTHAQKLGDWFTALPAGATRVAGMLAGVLGLLMIGLAVSQMGDAFLAAAVIYGALMAAVGIVYQYPPIAKKLVRPWTSEGQVWLARLGAAFILAISLLLVILAFYAA